MTKRKVKGLGCIAGVVEHLSQTLPIFDGPVKRREVWL